jgi:hypothetical protein
MGRKNEEQVHPLAPTPRARFRFDQGDVKAATVEIGLAQPLDAVQFYNKFPYQCNTNVSEKMYGVSIPGSPTYSK